MNKKGQAWILLLVLFITLFLIFFFYDTLMNMYNHFFLSLSLYLQILIGILLFSLLVLIIYLLFRKNTVAWMLSFYKLNMNGLIILEAENKLQQEQKFTEQFKESVVEFQTAFDFLNFNIDYSSQKVKIEVKTPGEITVKKGEKIVGSIVDNLNHIMDLAPDRNILININIDGILTNLREKIKFVIVNNRREVGIRKNRYNKNIFTKLFYVNK